MINRNQNILHFIQQKKRKREKKNANDHVKEFHQRYTSSTYPTPQLSKTPWTIFQAVDSLYHRWYHWLPPIWITSKIIHSHIDRWTCAKLVHLNSKISEKPFMHCLLTFGKHLIALTTTLSFPRLQKWVKAVP